MSFERANAVVGQSGGPTSAINATLSGVIRACLECEAVETVFGMRNGIEGLEKEDIFPLNPYFERKPSQLELLAATPAAALGSCRKKIKDDELIEALYKVFEKNNIRYFFYIGGNDSMDTIMKLSDYAERHRDEGIFDVKFIGVPKTIDNDLEVTDHPPGYGSAAKFVATVMQEICRDCAVYTQKAVTIIEIMGRDAGWLTASAALSKYLTGIGPDLVYLPEKIFDVEEFVKDVNKRLQNPDKPYVVIAVSEGIKLSDGRYLGETKSAAGDAFGHGTLTGAGRVLESIVRDKIGCKCRSVELNVLQRCAAHVASACDIEESKRIGYAAVKYAIKGESGKMICLRRLKNSDCYRTEIFAEDVKNIANKIKVVPQSFLSSDGSGVNDRGIDYMLPLIKGELDVIYEDGIPVHFEF